MERDAKRDYLITLREGTGMTRKEFAVEFEIPYPTITDWELGHRRIPEYFLRLLAYKIGLEKQDCCFTRGNKWFRYRAAGIIVEDDRTLFVTSKNTDYFYTVGGGVFMGESSEECVKREVREETGVDYEIDHLAVVVENFFSGKGGKIDGKACQCLEFYYLMKPRGSMEVHGKSINSDNEEEILRWLRVNEIQDYNIKPSFLKDRFEEIVKGKDIIHIVTDADRNV